MSQKVVQKISLNIKLRLENRVKDLEFNCAELRQNEEMQRRLNFHLVPQSGRRLQTD